MKTENEDVEKKIDDIQKPQEILEELIDENKSEPMAVGKAMNGFLSSGKRYVAVLLAGAVIGGSVEYIKEPIRKSIDAVYAQVYVVNEDSFADGRHMRVERHLNEKKNIEWYLVDTSIDEKKIIDNRGLVTGDVEDRLYGNIKNILKKSKQHLDEFAEKGKELVMEYSEKGKTYVIKITEKGKVALDESVEEGLGSKVKEILIKGKDYSVRLYNTVMEKVDEVMGDKNADN